MAEEEMVLGLDVGGTKLAAGVVDAEGRLVGRRQVETPAGTDGEALFAVVAALVDGVREGMAGDAELVGFGVGCGGPMTATGVSPLNIPAWRGFPLRDRLAAHTGLPVVVDNDAKALALGEGWVGAARGVRDYLAMVVSTGVGGGIVLDGRMLDGHDGNAGHIGHLIVEPGGRLCPCGAHGCLEAEASGTAIRAITGGHPKDAPDEVRARTGTLVGRAVASVANLLDLRLACVAGSVALGYGDVFLTAARAELAASARIAHARGTEIRIGALGDEGPLVGAGALGWRAAGRSITAPV
jgi:glucokinase